MKNVILTIIATTISICCYNQNTGFLESRVIQLATDPYENHDSIYYYSNILIGEDSLNPIAIEYYLLALDVNYFKEEKLKFLDFLIKHVPYNPKYWYERGNLKLFILDDETGVSDLLKSYEIDNSSLDGIYNLAAYYLNIAELKQDSLTGLLRSGGVELSEEVRKSITLDKPFYEMEACKFIEKLISLDSGSFYEWRHALLMLYKRQGLFGKADSIAKIDYPVVTDSFFLPKSPYQLYFPEESFLDTINRFYQREPDSVFLENMKSWAIFHNRWYSEHLFAMKEPILFVQNNHKEIYRFAWLRSFDEPIAIRVEKSEEGIFLFVKVCDGKGGYEPGKLTVNQKIRLTKKKWKKFSEALTKYDFWSTSPIEKTNVLICDGARWILEGKSKKGYHVVDRHSPGEYRDNEFRELCLYILKLSDLSVKGRIY